MNPLKKFKLVNSENKTFLVFSAGKKETINYTQMSMFEGADYQKYFVPFQCTKTSRSNRISYDVSGLTAIADLIRSPMDQAQYFRIIKGIQEIASFCGEHHLPCDNLVSVPKYMYYDHADNSVKMAFVPLKKAHYLSFEIPDCLQKINKKAKAIKITDGNYQQKYEQYLQELSTGSGNKKTREFSPVSLMHFFNINGMPALGMKPPASNSQIHAKAAAIPEIPVRPAAYATSGSWSPLTAREDTGTVIIDQTDKPCLVSENGMRYFIDDVSRPFRIGRGAGSDLVINVNTVSGKHAEIFMKNGKFMLRDISRNGTFLGTPDNRISETELSDGADIFFHNQKYTFLLNGFTAESPSAPVSSPVTATAIVDAESSGAVGVQSTGKPLAYIRRVSDGLSIAVRQYPFSTDELPGVIFHRETAASGRKRLVMENDICQALKLEDTNIPCGRKTEIFSGCSIFIWGEKYSFIVEN